jgi:hypothetical protein
MERRMEKKLGDGDNGQLGLEEPENSAIIGQRRAGEAAKQTPKWNGIGIQALAFQSLIIFS